MRKNYIAALRAITIAFVLAVIITITAQGHVMEWQYIV